MIVFDLSCECGTEFEGWFQDSADFRNQEIKGLLICPECGSPRVKKILSPVRTFAVKPGESSAVEDQYAELEKNAREALSSLQEFVKNNFDDVGTELASESLKAHYGLAEPRNIRGVATEAEEEMLEKEGIKLLKIPMPEKSSEN